MRKFLVSFTIVFTLGTPETSRSKAVILTRTYHWLTLSDGSSAHSVEVLKTSETFKFEVSDQNDQDAFYFNHVDVGKGLIIQFYEAISDFSAHSPFGFDGYIIESKGIVDGIRPLSLKKSFGNVATGWILLLIFGLFITLIGAIKAIVNWFFYEEPFRLFELSDNPWWVNAFLACAFFVLVIYLSLSGPIRAILYRIPRFELLDDRLQKVGAEDD